MLSGKASGAALWGKLLALFENIRLGMKGFQGSNTLAYLIYLYIMVVKSYIVFAIYDNNFTSIINIYICETFSTFKPLLKALALHSLDTLSHITIKAFMLLF
jgi:hypothetical protein